MKVGAFELVEPVPELREACAIAMLKPWVDVGRVGTLALTRLEQYLGAREVGRLARPGVFFDFTRYRPQLRFVEGRRFLVIPNTNVYHARDQRTGRDYLFLHIREPHAMGEEYAESIVQLLEFFHVTEYCRVGSMYDSVPHTRPLMVTGSLTQEQLAKAGSLVSRRRSRYQGPTSIVNLVADALAEKGITSTSLMVHIPQYVQLEEDHLGAARLLEVLCALYGFPSGLADDRRGQQQYMDISRAVETNPEVRALVQRLENYYDRMLAVPEEGEEDPSLSPEVERFLREVTERMEDQGEGPHQGRE